MSDITELTQKIDRLRADLAASNDAIAALHCALPEQQRPMVLAVLERAQQQRQALYAGAPIPEAERTALQTAFADSAARMTQLLQGAPGYLGR